MRTLWAVALVAWTSGCVLARPAPEPAPAELLRAVVRQLSGAFVQRAAVCLEFVGAKAPPIDASWAANGNQVVPSSDCPPTYESPILVVDSAGRRVGPVRPSGYVDPYEVRVWPPRRGFALETLVRVEVRQGTRGERFLCEVRSSPPPLSASCGRVGLWIS